MTQNGTISMASTESPAPLSDAIRDRFLLHCLLQMEKAFEESRARRAVFAAFLASLNATWDPRRRRLFIPDAPKSPAPLSSTAEPRPVRRCRSVAPQAGDEDVVASEITELRLDNESAMMDVD
jgi:hypothetical protein